MDQAKLQAVAEKMRALADELAAAIGDQSGMPSQDAEAGQQQVGAQPGGMDAAALAGILGR
jgi:hypothetical protein